MTGRVIKHVSFRGGILLIFAVFALVFGLGSLGAHVPEQAQVNAHVITDIAPLEFWYAAWTFTGVLCVLGAFIKRVDPIAYGAWIFLCSVFVFGYSAAEYLAWRGALLTDPPVLRAWLAAAFFGALGLLGYIESRRP